MRFLFPLLWASLLWLVSTPALAQPDQPLIDGATLHTQIGVDPSLVLVDVRPAEAFAEGHLPTAQQVWRPDIRDTENTIQGLAAPKEKMEALLSRLGVRQTDRLVLYDAKGNPDAARLWWLLKGYGFTNVQLLDGGLVAWQQDGYEVSREIAGRAMSDFKFSNPVDASLYASTGEVQNALYDGRTVLIDTRSEAEFTGERQKKGAAQPGRIPGSWHMDWAAAIHYTGDMRIRSLDTLRSALEGMGLTQDRPIITWCHSGTRSAHTTFVLTQLLGYQNVRNYDGSWIEWSQTEGLPVESGKPAESEDESGTETAELAPADASQLDYVRIAKESFVGFANYTWNEITFNVSPWYVNYFWWLIILSLAVWGLEILFPWRKNQPIIRKDFWLDAFYMFFNFYIFKLVIFIAFSSVTEEVFKSVFGGDLSSLAIVDLSSFPGWAQLLIFFVATDFIQWFTHVMLHRFDFLWKFHKVHHSVEQMGFAAHLRYHWMENVFYTPMKYIMVMLLGGFTPEQAYIVFYLAIAIGHLNHANLKWTYGPLKYVFNNPYMHIWHHAYSLPESRQHGVNFAISLSTWDYLFRTAYIPRDGGQIRLGFAKIEEFPKRFWGQLVHGFWPKRSGQSD